MKEIIFILGFFTLIGTFTAWENSQSNITRSIASIDELKNSSLTQREFKRFMRKNKLRRQVISGELQAVISDEFGSTPSSSVEYFLNHGNGEKTDIDFISNVERSLIGKEVQVLGFNENLKVIGMLKNSHRNFNHDYAEPDAPLSPMPKKSVIFFVKFNNSMDTQVTMNQAQTLLDTSYRNFYKAMSNNMVEHESTAIGWVHLDRDGDDDGNYARKCEVSNQEIRDMAADFNVNLMEYENVTVFSNCVEYSTIGGRATLGYYDFLGIGRKQNWIRIASNPSRLSIPSPPNPYVHNWDSFISILVHERGHNFGLMHSNGLDCGDHFYFQNCAHVEYGNPIDRMGAPVGSYTFNADQQRRAGWKSEETNFLHIKEDGVFHLDYLTKEGTENKIGAYIYLEGSDQKMFMVEFRQPFGFDNNLADPNHHRVRNGVHVYSVMRPSQENTSPVIGTQFRYIDTKPTENSWRLDTAWDSHQGTLIDPATGIEITFNRITYDGRAQFVVSYNEEEQLCFKKDIDDWLSRPYVLRFEETSTFPHVNKGKKRRRPASVKKSKRLTKQSKSKRLVRPTVIKPVEDREQHIVLVPGDRFFVKYDVFLADHLMCPRNRLKVHWTNYGSLRSWLTNDGERPGGGGGGENPAINIGSTDVGGFQSMEHDDNLITHTITNYENTYNFKEMKVPASALGSDYQLNYSTNTLDNSQSKQFKIWIHVRSSHDAVIPIAVELPDR